MEENKKQLVVITGANSGIGLACVNLFLEKGYPVLGIDKEIEVVSQIKDKNLVVSKVDVKDYASLKKSIKEARQKFGDVDLLINNAGVMYLERYDKQDLNEKYDMLDTNIKGVVNGMDAVLSDMVKRNCGTIINISSVAGRYTYNNHAIYNSTKFAVNAVTEQIRRELAHTNIRFSLIEPAIVDTNLLENTKNKEIYDDYKKWRDEINGGLKPKTIAETAFYIYSLPQDISIKEIMLSHTNETDV
ncbi:Oxidoreductase, short chain dehydrogenase-reductase family [Metamycoplasma auris 15026]|uniref:Oxidoreductase, short chain dehydrogenase-reductase family n=1 Tax=Metamycoplasma auris 15026 TaxID=1188233 RepID=N9TT23_9BACT|nr:SDR family oxidoreductase [Metamycoplasma auris]ENY69304.1 Oxidoreductase, short chain dehydrogenase-reductase family [Metamycoplasma auris 15026]